MAYPGGILMDFQCKDNCGECCGPVMIDKEVVERNRNKFNGVPTLEKEFGNSLIITKGIWCIFLDENKRCAIYNERPEICRKFGKIKRLPCPYFDLRGEKRSERMVKKFKRKEAGKMEKIIKLIQKKASMK